MLVLTRKAKQQIQIGPHITITILQIKGQAIRVGIEAPRDMCVLRSEIAGKFLSEADHATVMAAVSSTQHEVEHAATSNPEKRGPVQPSTDKSLRCRAPRVDEAPMSPSYPSTGPASFLRPRRRRAAFR
jgi:carbon storage regulator